MIDCFHDVGVARMCNYARYDFLLLVRGCLSHCCKDTITWITARLCSGGSCIPTGSGLVQFSTNSMNLTFMKRTFYNIHYSVFPLQFVVMRTLKARFNTHNVVDGEANFTGGKIFRDNQQSGFYHNLQSRVWPDCKTLRYFLCLDELFQNAFIHVSCQMASRLAPGKNKAMPLRPAWKLEELGFIAARRYLNSIRRRKNSAAWRFGVYFL